MSLNIAISIILINLLQNYNSSKIFFVFLDNYKQVLIIFHTKLILILILMYYDHIIIISYICLRKEFSSRSYLNLSINRILINGLKLFSEKLSQKTIHYIFSRSDIFIMYSDSETVR